VGRSNEAARLTELAKGRPGRVVASLASAAEAVKGDAVGLRSAASRFGPVIADCDFRTGSGAQPVV